MGSRRSIVRRLKFEMNMKSCFAVTAVMLSRARTIAIILEAILDKTVVKIAKLWLEGERMSWAEVGKAVIGAVCVICH